MSGPYKVTLVQLKANALGLAPAGEKLELGMISAEEIYKLAGNLLLLSNVADLKDEPGIIVHRGDKGWRIAIHSGRLCMHKSTSLFDEFWTVDNAKGLADLPPFRSDRPVPRNAPRVVGTATGRFAGVRAIGEVVGLFVLGVSLVIVGLYFGLPHKRISDLPPGVELVSSDSEAATIFTALAGKYATGLSRGEQIVTISPDGHVTISYIGKDGTPLAPRIDGQARAVRKGELAAVWLPAQFVIAESPTDAVKIGYQPTRWKKLVN
jgi:hypothetical protein